MSEPIIYINIGHSDRDPGAVGYETERPLAVAAGKHMCEYLEQNFVCEVFSNPGTMDDLIEICHDANKRGAALFISIHFNAGRGDGFECYVYSEKRRPLGELFEKAVLAIGQNSRGVKIQPGFTVLAETNMPAILLEGAFVDNLKDIQDWNDDAELKVLGEAYAKAAAEFVGAQRKAIPAEPAAPAEPVQEYSLVQFVRDVQAACGAAVDGVAGPETLGKTVTVSARLNRTHKAVKPLQRRLAALGYTQVGEADGIAGSKFDTAVKAFQRDHGCTQDGEITARNKTWRCLLGMA